MPVALVTGGSRGLGQALAYGLVRNGWRVVTDGRDPEALARARDDLGSSLVAVPGDITDDPHRERLVSEARALGGLDLLVNNASALGPSPQPTLDRYPLGELRRVLEVNLVAPLGLIQQALPLLGVSERPRVLNVSSDASVEAYPAWGGYGSSKAALDHLSAVLAAEQPGLSVWVVDPGDMRTQMHQDAFPGEDISDRPLPDTVVPPLLSLIESDAPSGRYRVAELAGVGGL